MLMLLGALISAGGALAGGLLQKKGQKESRSHATSQQQLSFRQNQALAEADRSFAERWNTIGHTFADREAARNQANVDFARNRSIQARVADAKAAGLHPLYALGAASAEVGQPISFSGQSPSGGSVGAITGDSYGGALGEGLAAAGRSLGSHVSGKAARAAALRAEARTSRESNARVLRDEAEAAYLASRAKVVEQEANYGPVRTSAVEALEQIPGRPLPPAGIPQEVVSQKISAPHDVVKHSKGLYGRRYSEEQYGEIAGIMNILSDYLTFGREAGRLSRHRRSFQPKRGSPMWKYYWRNYR